MQFVPQNCGLPLNDFTTTQNTAVLCTKTTGGILEDGVPSAETSPRRLPPHANPRWRPTQHFLGVANLPQLAARQQRRSPSTARLCPEPSRRPSLTVRRHGSALPSTAEAPHEHRNAAKNKPTQPKTTIPADDQRFRRRGADYQHKIHTYTATRMAKKRPADAGRLTE
jgi:hypothetical protein